MKKKTWVKTAVKKPGAFRSWCNKRGHKGANTSCINSGLKSSKGPTTRKRAGLAKAFKNMRKKKK